MAHPSQPDRFSWLHTYRYNIMVLKIAGLWPKGVESYKRDFYTLYMVVAHLIFQVGHVFFQTVNLFMTINDLEAFTNNISLVLMETSIVLKTYCLVKNMGMLKALTITLESDLFQPKGQHQIKLVEPNLRAWKIVAAAFCSFAVGCITFWLLFPILDKSTKNYQLPYLAWYPYNIRQSPHYELTYLYQVIALIYMLMANLNTDTLIAALNMYIGSQFDILCDDLRNLHVPEEFPDVKSKLKHCIHHHREILKFAEHANEFYNWLLFVKFFVGGVSLGITLFQMTIVVPNTCEFYSIGGYATAVCLEVFMYCWFGNEVEVKSSKISYAIFESDWTGFSPEVKKIMIIFVLNVHKSLQISALGLFNLSLETYVKILRTAYSYFALLRQVNTPE